MRTLHVDHPGPGQPLTKYTEVWVTGHDQIKRGAPDAIRQTGLWIGVGLPAGPHNHFSLELGVGVRDQLGSHPLPTPPAALPNPTPITASPDAHASLVRTFAASGWLKIWLGFEVLKDDLKKVPVPNDPLTESLFFKWQIRNFASSRLAFSPTAIVATQRPPGPNPGPGTGFEQNFTLGLSLLTTKKVTSGTDLDYFEIDAHTFL